LRRPQLRKPDDSADARLQILLAEYHNVRDDARTASSIFAALAGVVIVVVAGATALLFGTRQFDELPNWVFAVLPALPVILAAYGVIAGTGVVMRTYYARAIERELQLMNSPVRLGLQSERRKKLPVPSWMHLEIMVGGAPGRSDMLQSALWQIVTGGLYLLLFGLVVLPIVRIRPLPLLVVATLSYGSAFVLIIRAGVRNTQRGYELWASLVNNLDDAIARPLWGRPRGPGMRIPIKYLLLPRPNDLVKMFLIPGTALLAWASTSSNTLTWPLISAVVFWLSFEIIAYQGRYLYNDVRDRFLDRKHPDPDRANRFPLWQSNDPDKALRVAFYSFLTRCVIALAIGLYLWNTDARLGFWYLGSLVALMIYSYLYERRRDLTTSKPPSRRRGWLPLWLLVGCGYGLRLMVGWVLGARDATGLELALVGLAGLTLGLAFVTMTWALEATTLVGSGGVWQGPRHFKPHLRPLLEIALEKGPSERAGVRVIPSDDRVFLLHGLAVDDSSPVLASPSRILAPWDWAAILSITLLAGLGALGSLGRDSTSVMLVVVVALASSVFSTRLPISWAWSVILIGGVVIVGLSRESLHGSSAVLRLLALVGGYSLAGAIYLSFRSFNYADHIRPNFMTSLIKPIRSADSTLYRLFARPRRSPDQSDAEPPN
jgi:hypothetical protein